MIAQNTANNAAGTIAHADVTACDPTKYPNLGTGGMAVTLFFYIFANSTNAGVPTYSDTWDQLGFDLLGPNPPGSVSMGIADSELHLHWSSVLDTDRAGYHVYCSPALPPGSVVGDAGTVDGGASVEGTAVADGGTPVDGGAPGVANSLCPNAAIIQGNPPPAGLSPSGTAGTITATDAYAKGLTNGVNYACAVSVYDVMQNDGFFSQVVCGTPKLVTDFFSAYKAAGGKGGGGFCSIGRRGSSVGLIIPLASLALLALRRLRSKARSARKPAG
jgi:hypothetical protein